MTHSASGLNANKSSPCALIISRHNTLLRTIGKPPVLHLFDHEPVQVLEETEQMSHAEENFQREMEMLDAVGVLLIPRGKTWII